MLQNTSRDPRQQHRYFQRTRVVATLPHQSINPKQYWKTLARWWEALTSSHDAEAWRDWVKQRQQHIDLHRIIVRQEESGSFRFRAAVFLLVLRVADFNLFERPPCQEYTNFLRSNFVRGWFPKINLFPEKEQVFLCKLLLLGAHTRCANEQDLMAYAWCAAEAISWSLPISLRRKLATFLESMSRLIAQEDATLLARVEQALKTHNQSMAR
ncbi:MAG: hypothetical protein KA054_01650 [Candidatus Moranbacteria bacterium]|nr:hypothetical protein [Candidatus Moranbacteria bacterium]